MKKSYSVLLRTDQILKLRSGSNASARVRHALNLYIKRVYFKEPSPPGYDNAFDNTQYTPGGGTRKVYTVHFFKTQVDYMKNSKDKVSHIIQHALDVYFMWEYLK